jgi:hypothetical protein
VGAFKRFRHLEKYTSVKCCVLDEPFCQLCRASACSSQSLLANWASIKVLLRSGLLKYLLTDPGQFDMSWCSVPADVVPSAAGLFFALGEEGTFALCKAKEDRIALCNEKVSLPPRTEMLVPPRFWRGFFFGPQPMTSSMRAVIPVKPVTTPASKSTTNPILVMAWGFACSSSGFIVPSHDSVRTAALAGQQIACDQLGELALSRIAFGPPRLKSGRGLIN